MRLPGKVGDIGIHGGLARGFFRSAVMALVLALLPMTVIASSLVARAVVTFCAPQPTLPPVSSCSACHSSIENRGLNDLTANGQWAISSATYSQFCPPDNATEVNASSDSPLTTSSNLSFSSNRASLLNGISVTSGSRGIGMGRGANYSTEDDLATPGSAQSESSGFSLSDSLRRLLKLSDKP